MKIYKKLTLSSFKPSPGEKSTWSLRLFLPTDGVGSEFLFADLPLDFDFARSTALVASIPISFR